MRWSELLDNTNFIQVFQDDDELIAAQSGEIVRGAQLSLKARGNSCSKVSPAACRQVSLTGLKSSKPIMPRAKCSNRS